MERYLLECFPEQDFTTLCLPPSTVPSILQGLPRQLNPNSPNFLQLKPGFADINVLKTRLLDKPVLHLFHQQKRSTSKIILIITYVVPGGFGDFFAQRHLKNTLKQRFPKARVVSLVCIQETYTHKVKSQDDELIIPFSSKDQLDPKRFEHQVQDLIKNASLIFEIPTQFPYAHELKLMLAPHATYLQIGEYGFMQSDTYLPHHPARCLGLHFLEYGLFIEAFAKCPLESFSNQALLQLILNHFSPSQYQSEHLMYFNYLATDYGAAMYLLTVLQHAVRAKRPCDIVCIDIGPFLKALQNYQDVIKQMPIHKLQVFFKQHTSTLEFNQPGINVRLIHTGHLSHEDFKILLHASHEPVGIRGNLSFSEALFLKKIFFYDPLPHNFPLYYELLSLSKLKNMNVFKWIQLFKPSPSPDLAAKQGADLLKETSFKTDFENLSAFIIHHLQADEHLANLASKTFYNQDHPEIKKKEQALTALFIDKKLSFLDYMKAMQHNISS